VQAYSLIDRVDQVEHFSKMDTSCGSNRLPDGCKKLLVYSRKEMSDDRWTRKTSNRWARSRAATLRDQTPCGSFVAGSCR
jgi:hypothetical protein